MHPLYVVAVFVTVAFAEKDQNKAESRNEYQINGGNSRSDDYRRLDDYQYEELPGPHVLRSTHSRDIAKPYDHGPEVKKQNMIIRKTYDPDYYEPTVILDYRYLKTGGRDYTRGPGGQYLILPKGIRTKEPKEFENYDALLEHLRLKNLAETGYRRAHYSDDDY